MEQQSSISRLYWLTADGQWELNLEDTDDNQIKFRAECLMSEAPMGIVGYAKYPAAPDYMRWTEYTRYARGVKRRSVVEDQVPKPIRLLEMLQ
jgi:hypothetical protein